MARRKPSSIPPNQLKPKVPDATPAPGATSPVGATEMAARATPVQQPVPPPAPPKPPVVATPPLQDRSAAIPVRPAPVDLPAATAASPESSKSAAPEVETPKSGLVSLGDALATAKPIHPEKHAPAPGPSSTPASVAPSALATPAARVTPTAPPAPAVVAAPAAAAPKVTAAADVKTGRTDRAAAAPVAVTPAAPVPAAPAQAVPAVSEEEIVKELPAIKSPEPQAEPEQPVAAAEPPAPAVPPMFVVVIAPELAPVAKVGGLGDVVYGLSRELEMRGNAVEIILPKYDCMRYDHVYGLCKTYENLAVPWFNGVINTDVWFGFVHGRKCFFIDPHSGDNFFNRGVFYGHNDDVLRFAFFCRAALEFMFKTGKHPEVIHCHDWQTALVPVLLYEMYQQLGMRHPRVCFTIHNFRHQGVTGEHVLRAVGLNRPDYFFHYDRLRDNHNPRAINLMKGGIVYSNFVTTVSPRHAWEAKDAGQGDGLEPTLHTHHYKFGGVLNGLDYEYFNPETDRYIPGHFNIKTIEKKYENKRALRHRFWLADNEKPIVAFIGRLDQQKGLDLVRHAIFYSLGNRAQFVLLGSSPEKAVNDHFQGLKRHLNDSPDCHLEIAYNEELAHLIYAGADMMVVPSRYEPCGLTQLISLRYGTVPIVRSVGGLADTVYDKDYSNRPLHERNGYVFSHADNAGLESALSRAISCYYQYPEHFRQLMLHGMRADYSWKEPGQHYLNIYEHIRDR